MCILNRSFQPWQYKSGHCKPPPLALHHHPPSPSTRSHPAYHYSWAAHQQAITARWECDTFHKSLSWEIAFLYPAWDCVWRKIKQKKTKQNKKKKLNCTHTRNKCSDFLRRLCPHTFIHDRGEMYSQKYVHRGMGRCTRLKGHFFFFFLCTNHPCSSLGY